VFFCPWNFEKYLYDIAIRYYEFDGFAVAVLQAHTRRAEKGALARKCQRH
jgi:hypothetical protein